MAPKKAPVSDATIKALIDQGVADALAEYEANRGSGNGHDNHGSGSVSGRTTNTTHECAYSDFLKFQPLNFKGTKEIVVLTQCALTWWNSHVKTVSHDAAYGIPWKTLMKMLTDKYCPRSEIKKLDNEIWNLKVKGTDVVEKYVGGLPDMIQGSVMASKPKTMQDAIKFAYDVMDQKIRTFAKRQARNKRKLDDSTRKNQTQQQPFKRQNVARAYPVEPGEKREYGGSLPLCAKCNYHHTNPCVAKCTNCKRVGHLARDCRSPAATNNQRAPRQFRRLLLVMNVESKGITRKIAQN
ncbi:retrovirus-related pol polyprotein from transposon 17.6 [Tanacetum coccineum]